jgi:hypothetical protein
MYAMESLMPMVFASMNRVMVTLFSKWLFESSFSDIGADGIELDEGGTGNVIVRMEKSTLKCNGGYCMVEGEVCIEGIMPLHPFDSLCCDEGKLDLDDGFDIDEAGEEFFIKGSDAIDNKDEGFDFDEEGPSNIVGTFILVTAKGNEDEGIKCSKAGEGNVDVVLTACTVINNLSNDGIEFESEDKGCTDVVMVNTQAFGNTRGADHKVVQDDKIEQGSLKIVSSSTIGNVKTTNVILEETRN